MRQSLLGSVIALDSSTSPGRPTSPGCRRRPEAQQLRHFPVPGFGRPGGVPALQCCRTVPLPSEGQEKAEHLVEGAFHSRCRVDHARRPAHAPSASLAPRASSQPGSATWENRRALPDSRSRCTRSSEHTIRRTTARRHALLPQTIRSVPPRPRSRRRRPPCGQPPGSAPLPPGRPRRQQRRRAASGRSRHAAWRPRLGRPTARRRPADRRDGRRPCSSPLPGRQRARRAPAARGGASAGPPSAPVPGRPVTRRGGYGGARPTGCRQPGSPQDNPRRARRATTRASRDGAARTRGSRPRRGRTPAGGTSG